MCRPTLAYKLDKAVLKGRFKTPDRVISIEPDEKQNVYCLTTTTGNYVVQGYASKNCDFTNRARLAGCINIDGAAQHCLDVDNALLRHQEVASSMSGLERQKCDIEAEAVMQKISQEYGFKHYHRPFCLRLPKLAGAYSGAGIPVEQLPGYTQVREQPVPRR